MTRLTRLALAATLSFAVAACGSNSRDGGDPTPDAGSCTPSCTGATCGQADGCGGQCVGTCGGGGTCNTTTFTCETEQPECAVAETLGTVTLTTQEAVTDVNAPGEYVEFTGPINTDTKPDLFSIELYAGLEGSLFEGGLAEGTYEITGAEAQYQTCSICVFLIGDVDQQAQTSGGRYLATGGSITLTSVEGRLTGTLSNATFTQVDINDEFVSTPSDSGCTATLASTSFDAEIAEEDLFGE